MPPFGKATRKPPKGKLNPDGRLLRGFEKNGTAKIARALKELGNDLFDGLTESQVNQLIIRLNGDTTRDKLIEVLRPLIAEWAVAGATFGGSQITQLLGPIVADWTLVNRTAAAWAEQYTFRLVKELTDSTRATLQQSIRHFVENQETMGQLKERLIPAFGETRAQSIAVTEVTRAYAEGNLQAWQESGYVEGKQWQTNNDDLVCQICGPLHGVVVNLTDEFPGGFESPPGHPRCRCWIVPVVEGDNAS